MVKDAEAHAHEDAEKKKGIEVRNQADGLVYATEKSLSELSDVDPATREDVEAAIAETKQALEGSDIAAIEVATQKLERTAQRLSEAAYQQASQSMRDDGQTQDMGGTTQSQGPVEAEFVEGEGLEADLEGEATFLELLDSQQQLLNAERHVADISDVGPGCNCPIEG